MANEKKIAKNQKLLIFQLGEALKLEEKLKNEFDLKKQEKLQKKIKSCKEMIVFFGRMIGKEGGDIQNIWYEISDRQRQIMQELFPYGMEANDLEQQRGRLNVIDVYKKRISKLKKLEELYPQYDPFLSVEEKLKNRRYRMEKDIGQMLMLDSKKDSMSYEANWNYEEHFASTVEFSEEERLILERCYRIAQEYNQYLEQRSSFIGKLGNSIITMADNKEEKNKLSIARSWIKNSYTSIFPSIIRRMYPGRKYTAAEMEWEAKEMTKRFIQFIGNREWRDQLMEEWNRLMNDPSIRGYKEHERAAMVFQAVAPQISEETAWFTYACTQIPETKYGMELVLEYSYEELGLE